MHSVFSGRRFTVPLRIALSIVALLTGIGAFAGKFSELLPVCIVSVGAFGVWCMAGAAQRSFPHISAFATAFLPLIAYAVFYEPVHSLMAAVNPGIVDETLLAIDRAIFGANPILALHDISFPALTDFAYISYFSYYAGMPVLLMLMFFRNSRQDFEKVLGVMTLGWYLAFVSYLVFPALGPQRYLAGALPALHGWLPTTAWIQGFLHANLTPAVRDCVPSMHTAITILTLAYAFRYQRGFFAAYLLPGLGLIFATMYLQQHYVIDVLLGMVTAGVLYWANETVPLRSGRANTTPALVND